nr:fumarylacetoacetase [Sphingomonas bacterium]
MSGIDETHDPALTSWVAGADGHADFPIQNLPIGIFAPPSGRPRAGVAIGDMILDLEATTALLPEAAGSALSAATLNALFALPRDDRVALRRAVSRLLSDDRQRARLALHSASGCVMHLPAAIGDYTDFYVGIHHAQNVGRQFRPDSPLLTNYKWVPIGYHGRASSVRASGQPVIRPKGQRKAPDAPAPEYGPSRRLDYELEMGVWIGPGNALGATIPIGRAPEHIVGLSLLNDWSARDLQAWEYQPLGPFLAKNFLTSVSPWVVTAEALAPFRLAQPARPEGDPEPLPYLLDAADQAGGAFAITLSVGLTTAAMRAAGHAVHRLSRGPMTSAYWTIAQIVAHHASNGCDLHPGDLLGTGTLSGPDAGSFGSLLEISRGGTLSMSLPGGETRTFLEDGDEIVFTARAEADGYVPIGFGECRGRVEPASD